MKKTGVFCASSFALLIVFSCVSVGQVSVYRLNPHYLCYKDKPVVLITSDHHYGAVIDKDFDFKAYLNYLSVNGMNLTRIYPGGMFEPPDKYLKGNPLGPQQGRQLLPWAKSGITGANQLLAEAGKPSFKFDLDKWNTEYFARLRSFVELAGEKNIIVEIPFFNGMYADCWPLMAFYHKNNVQGIGKYEEDDCGMFTTAKPLNRDVMKYQKEYIRKIVLELNRYDNIIYDICDEPSLQGLKDGSITVRPDSLITPWIQEMKDAFLEAESKLPKKHLLGQTVQNLSPDLSVNAWCQWLPTEYVSPAANALSKDYDSDKPVIDVETNYFGTSLTKSVYTADAVRMEGWWFMLSGGAGIINLNGDFHRGNETGGVITRTEIIPQKTVLKKFLDSLDLRNIKRFNGFIVSEGCNACGLATDGKEYAMYLFHGAPDKEWGCSFVPVHGTFNDTLTIREMPEGSYKIVWSDPAAAKVLSTVHKKCKGGDMLLLTPPYSLDIALRIIKDK